MQSLENAKLDGILTLLGLVVHQLVPQQCAHVLERAPPLKPRDPVHQLRRHDLVLHQHNAEVSAEVLEGTGKPEQGNGMKTWSRSYSFSICSTSQLVESKGCQLMGGGAFGSDRSSDQPECSPGSTTTQIIDFNVSGSRSSTQ